MQASKENLYKHVEFLTDLTPARNYRNLYSLNTAANYIKDGFRSLGTKPTEQKWLVKGKQYRNIIATYNPGKKRRLVVGAHYDVAGEQPGADDNASAVAGLLESARMIFEEKPELDYTVEFVSYSLEEPPFFQTEEMGSFIHAKSLHDEKVNVMGMICYEMIGYFSDEPGSQDYPVKALSLMYPDKGNFILVMGGLKNPGFTQKIVKRMKKGSPIGVESLNLPENMEISQMSDHMNYRKFGYKAVMINDTSYYRNPNYHLKTDTIDTLDFDKMTDVVSSTYNAIVNL